MRNTALSPSRGARLALLAAFLCLIVVFPPFVTSYSLRSRNKPPETVEDSVAFSGEEEEAGPTKDVPIKPHSHGREPEGSESESAAASEKEEAEESEKEPPREDEEAEQPEGESEEERGPPKAKGTPMASKKAPAGGSEAESSATTAAESAAQSAEQPAAESAAESRSSAEPARTEAPAAPEAAGPQEGAPKGEQEAPRGTPPHLQEAEKTVVEQEVPTAVKKQEPPKEEKRDLGMKAVNERLTALGAPFTLGKEHFNVDFKHGLKLGASEFSALAEKNQGVLWRAVSEEPSISSEKTLFLTIDIDDMFIGTDVRLVQLSVKPEACTVEAEGACKTHWFLREPSPASPPHRIVILGFSSPVGEKFEFDDLLQKIQQKPNDVDLRRISLSRFFEAHAKFFNDEHSNFAAVPSWHEFALVSHGAGEESEPQMDHPLVQLPPNATEQQKAQAQRLSEETNEEVDNLSTPQHGGESPGAGGRVDTSTIFKYVLGSLLLIGLFVGVAVSVCSFVPRN